MAFEVSAVMTLPTTSFCVSPSSAARVRSISSCSGGIIEILRDEDVADARDLADLAGQLQGGARSCCARFEPDTCTSMGAGMPRLRTASTRPPDWK